MGADRVDAVPASRQWKTLRRNGRRRRAGGATPRSTPGCGRRRACCTAGRAGPDCTSRAWRGRPASARTRCTGAIPTPSRSCWMRWPTKPCPPSPAICRSRRRWSRTRARCFPTSPAATGTPICGFTSTVRSIRMCCSSTASGWWSRRSGTPCGVLERAREDGRIHPETSCPAVIEALGGAVMVHALATVPNHGEGVGAPNPATVLQLTAFVQQILHGRLTGRENRVKSSAGRRRPRPTASR